MDSSFDFAYKLGSGRLIFEHGALRHLGSEARRHGHRALVIAGEHAWQTAGEAVSHSLWETGFPFVCEQYAGACSEEKAHDIARRCREEGFDLLIGVGGGRMMDLIKMGAAVAGLPVLTVPTIAATCAAYTPLSVVYTPEGACRGSWYLRDEVQGVICDLDVLCRQPSRCLAAGILDSMAKYIEIQHYREMDVSRRADLMTAAMLAEMMYRELSVRGQEAVEELAEGKPSEAVERCVFHTIVTTGLISGMARGQHQSALAHALYEALRSLHTRDCAGYLHGELVAVGLLLEARYTGLPEEEACVRGMLEKWGLPTSLAALGVGVDAQRQALACHPTVTKYGDANRVLEILNELA